MIADARPLDRVDGGRFAAGNMGGPGRPRRRVEESYLLALADVVSVKAWRKIVRRAMKDAMNGDFKARAWLARYLLGDSPPSLLDLAIDQAGGMDVDAKIAERVASRAESAALTALLTSSPPPRAEPAAEPAESEEQ